MSELNNKKKIDTQPQSTIFSSATGGHASATKRKIAPFISLGAVFLVLLSTLITLLIVFREEPEETPPKFDVWEGESSIGNAAHLAYPLIDENSVTEIDIYNDGESYTFIKYWLEDSGTYDWRIKGTEKIDLNATNFEVLRMWLCQATTKTPIRNASEDELENYGVDKANHNGYTVTFLEKDAISGEDVEKSYTVRIGEKSSSKDNIYYAYIEGRPHVYKLAAGLVQYTEYERFDYYSPVINTFFGGETQALMGIDRFDIYLTNGSNTSLTDVVSLRVNEKGDTTVEFKAVYGFDSLGRRRTTIASTTYASSVFTTLYTAFGGERVVAINPTSEELASFGLCPEQEKYFINVEFSENASFKHASYKNYEPSLYISRLIDDCYYVLSEYFGQEVIVKVPKSTLNFLGETSEKLILWTDTNSVKTGFYDAITETETEPGVEKLVLKTPTNEETFILSYDQDTDILTVTGVTSGLVFKDNPDAETSFEKNRFRNLYVYLVYFPFVHEFNGMTDSETLEYITNESLKYSITSYRNDGTAIRYSYYATSASLAIEKVESGVVTSDGYVWEEPSYGNICAMEEIRRVINAIDKLLAGEDLLPDEDILG